MPTPTIRWYWLDCQIKLFRSLFLRMQIICHPIFFNETNLPTLSPLSSTTSTLNKSFNPFCSSHCFIESYIRKIRPNVYKDFQDKMSAFFTIFDSPISRYLNQSMILQPLEPIIMTKTSRLRLRITNGYYIYDWDWTNEKTWKISEKCMKLDPSYTTLPIPSLPNYWTIVNLVDGHISRLNV